jgi:hypothetical protein
MSLTVPENLAVENQINLFFHNHSLGQLLRQSNVRKVRGISLDTLFQFLLSLAFTGKNLFCLLDSSDGSVQGVRKDAAYRLLNSVNANWRRFLLFLSTRIIVDRLEPMTSDANRKVLIVDDTLYRRDRSKKVELLARVHDHNSGLYHRGFRMLTLGWSDGGSFLPMMFSLLSSATEKSRLVPMRENLDKRTNGYKRRQESIRKSPDVLIDMIKLVVSAGVTARYLLFDSWFAFPSTICTLRALGMHTICMLKDMPNIRYTFEGKQLALKGLYKQVKKRPGRAKILASCLVTIGGDKASCQAKIVFVRDRSTKSWLGLLSTDTALTDEEIITLYKRRWDIEVFFKMAKSFLNLAKECQSRSYDALVAHSTLVCCRYIMLETARRTTADPRTLGRLFHATCDEIRQASFVDALALLLSLLEQTLLNIVGFTKEQIRQWVAQFIAMLPPVFRNPLLLMVTNEAIRY